MKKTLDGKTYNTETAIPLANWDNRENYGDYRFENQVLYVTKKGAYFIHGRGGGGTDWGTNNGNARCGGQGIEPISKDEALRWCEKYGAEDVIEEHFAADVSEA